MSTRWASGRAALATLAISAAFGLAASHESGGPVACRILLLAEIEGPIGPATICLVEKVPAWLAELVILRIDTPGGLADAMRDIISVADISSERTSNVVFPQPVDLLPKNLRGGGPEREGG